MRELPFRPDGTISTGSATVRIQIALDGQITARYRSVPEFMENISR